MSRQILVNASHYETRVATLEDGEIRQLHIEREEDRNVVGNIYKGVVKRVLPGMQAAFLELGLERTAFLYVDDIIDEPFGTDFEVMEDEGDAGADESTADDDGAYEPETYQDRGPDKPRDNNRGGRGRGGGGGKQDARGPVDDRPRDNRGGRGEVNRHPDDRPRNPDREPRDRDNRDARGPREPEGRGPRDPEARGPRDLDVRGPREPQGRGPREPGPRDVEARGPRDSRDRDLPPARGGRDNSRLPDDRGERDLRDVPLSRDLEAHPDDRDYRDEPDYEDDRYEDDLDAPVDDRPLDDRDIDDRDDYPEDRDGEPLDGDRAYHEDDRPVGDRGPADDRGPAEDRGPAPRRDSGPRPQRGQRNNNNRNRGRSGSRGGRNNRPGQRRGRFSHRRPRGSAKIEDLLKEGQEILVQVAKAPIGTKGARLTTHISLPGRNLVLMPTVKHLGISRRIGSERERRRLRDIFTKKIRPKDVGFIIRTVAEGKSYRDIRADADYLIKLWDQINHDSKKKRAPSLIHEDLSLGMRAVRDFFTEDVDSFIIDNSEEYENVLDFVGQFMPKLESRVKLFKGPSQLFEHYGIEAEISRALGKKVWLKSGGYLLIDQSEALTAIDVNTGRYVGSKSLEETILKTNLEAVKEVAYQLRIRNVGGIIIIDLIDMENLDNREKVYQALSEALGEDRAKTNILKISELGLVEMTRKRTHEDLVRYLTEPCSHCDGRGYHKSRRTVCFEIFREIEKEGLSNNRNIMVFAHGNVVTRMTVEEKEHLKLLEKRFDKNIVVQVDPKFDMEQYEVYGRA